MSQILITTSQNVNVSFRLASVGERLGAFLLDLLILIAYVFITSMLFYNVFNLERRIQGLDMWSVIAIQIMLNFPVIVYTLVSESLMEGQTIGKKILKIKVVKIEGYQAGFGDYLMRWVFRLVDIYSNSGLVGLISMTVSKNNQRIGDMATGTAVISLKNKVNISHTILENIHEDYVPLIPEVIALNDDDLRIIKENFVRARSTNDKEIIVALAKKIRSILKHHENPKKLTDIQYIESILKDYNFYTGRQM